MRMCRAVTWSVNCNRLKEYNSLSKQITNIVKPDDSEAACSSVRVCCKPGLLSRANYYSNQYALQS